MKDESYIGIDYGLGWTNRDRETDIHYGVISSNSFYSDDAEPIYPDPEYELECDECGATFTYVGTDETTECPECGAPVDVPDSDFLDAEPIGWEFGGEDDGYQIECSDLTFGVFVLKSPYYTRCGFCSPCAPGAGDLDWPKENGVKTFALGPEWFEDERAPYPLWRVDDDTPVPPNKLGAKP